MAVHVLAVLAYKQGAPVTSDFLASSVNTNPVVIRRLLLVLRQAGFIETRKGAGLGSRLRKEPLEINLADVYGAVESEDPFSLPARRPNQACPVGHCIQAALQNIFASAQLALEAELEKTTLADVLESVNGMCAETKKGRG